jgi:hypothetical protein
MCCAVPCLGPWAVQSLGRGGKRGTDTRPSREHVKPNPRSQRPPVRLRKVQRHGFAPWGHLGLVIASPSQDMSAAMTTSGGRNGFLLRVEPLARGVPLSLLPMFPTVSGLVFHQGVNPRLRHDSKVEHDHSNSNWLFEWLRFHDTVAWFLSRTSDSRDSSRC